MLGVTCYPVCMCLTERCLAGSIYLMPLLLVHAIDKLSQRHILECCDFFCTEGAIDCILVEKQRNALETAQRLSPCSYNKCLSWSMDKEAFAALHPKLSYSL